MDTKAFSRTVAHNLYHYRTLRNFTQAQLAEQAGITVRSYSSLESGSGNPTLATLHSLAKILEITASRILSLDFLHINEPVIEFITRYKNAFEDSSLAASIRDLEGILHYRNRAFEQHFPLPTLTGEPFDLLRGIPENAKEILRNQLLSEKKGVINPYVNFGLNSKTGEKVFFRFYPCLIKQRKEESANLAAIYMTPASQDNQSDYYRFCELLLGCAQSGSTIN